ncbi:hypothetical protein MANES_08G025400v8 [Manihot esculenta]|uniref:Uncharacterized protein n=1 Tax=Manihot esculenta TaxID=3983 RepID=A0ACB7H8V3_MANES|nr:hypothetical protein MANES_08G025400v8 [Manihot esculenta]
MASISTCFTVSAKSRLPYSHPIFTSKPSFRLKPPDSIAIIQPLRSSRIASKVANSRVSAASVRASIDFPNGIRPGAAVESDKLPADVRKRTMEAVDACGGRVTIGDVASRAGLNLNEAQKSLQALATDTDGFLEVSDEGDVLYVFPKDYRSKLASKSFRMKVEPLIEKAKATAEYLIRVSFGTALIASIVIVYTTIIALLSSRSEEDNRGRRGGRSYDSGFTFYFSPTDLFWYWDPYYYRRRQVQTDGDGKMNFIESVFSFVFGDGDPNQGIEEERWKLIGQYISSNGGVVTAEELAPYLDLQTNEQTMNDESYILPVLLRFDGQPEIDEERTASSQRSRRKEYVGRRWADWIGLEKFFREKKWQFRFFICLVMPLNLIYAGSFFAIPLIRWFLVRKRNAEIEKRNQAREQVARTLELPDPSLRRKLLSARDMAQRTVIGQDRIVYSTDRDIIEQDVEAQEWDRRFREIEKSE